MGGTGDKRPFERAYGEMPWICPHLIRRLRGTGFWTAFPLRTCPSIIFGPPSSHTVSWPGFQTPCSSTGVFPELILLEDEAQFWAVLGLFVFGCLCLFCFSQRETCKKKGQPEQECEQP